MIFVFADGPDIYLRSLAPTAPLSVSPPSSTGQAPSASATASADNGSPRRDDAKKWAIAQELVTGAAKIGTACVAIVDHYPTPYSEAISADLADAFTTIQWKHFHYISTAELPRGISFRASDKNGIACAELVRQAMGLAIPPVERLPSPVSPTSIDYFFACPGCFEIRIGNEPEQKRS